MEILQEIARKAGQEIMTVYNTGFEVEEKSDRSPLTEAEKRANDLIVSELAKHFPQIPILSEEGRDIPFEERSSWTTFFLVDPWMAPRNSLKEMMNSR